MPVPQDDSGDKHLPLPLGQWKALGGNTSQRLSPFTVTRPGCGAQSSNSPARRRAQITSNPPALWPALIPSL